MSRYSRQIARKSAIRFSLFNGSARYLAMARLYSLKTRATTIKTICELKETNKGERNRDKARNGPNRPR
jgi:hypothetical protein